MTRFIPRGEPKKRKVKVRGAPPAPKYTISPVARENIPFIPSRRSGHAKMLSITNQEGFGFSFRMDLGGFDELIGLAEDDVFAESVQDIGNKIYQRAFELCPKPPTPETNKYYQRTGNLSESIEVHVRVDPSRMVTVQIGVPKEKADYAVHVEYGSVTVRAQPFLRPAIDENRSNALVYIGREVALLVRMALARRGNV